MCCEAIMNLADLLSLGLCVPLSSELLPTVLGGTTLSLRGMRGGVMVNLTDLVILGLCVLLSSELLAIG